LLGDVDVGKTCLMLRYIRNLFDEDYTPTIGCGFLEKVVELKNAKITFNVYDLGGSESFLPMIGTVCNGAFVILYLFDLTKPQTLNSISRWYDEATSVNREAFPILVGTKYDKFVEFSHEDKEEITKRARKYAELMNAPLIFSSSAWKINIKKIFRLIVARYFNLQCKLPKITEIGKPIFEF